MSALIKLWIKRLWNRVAFWTRAPEEAAGEPPAAAVGHNRKPRRKKEEPESYGAFYYLENILEDLDDYRASVKQMRRFDPDAFDYYSRVGAQVVANKAVVEHQELPPVWRHGGERPARGMIHFASRHCKDPDYWLHGSLISYLKIKTREGVEVAPGDLYEVTIFARDLKLQKGFAAPKYHVAVDAAGEVRVLRERHVERVGAIPMRTWRLPEWLADSPADAKQRGSAPRTASEKGATSFRIAANFVESAANGVQVRAAKGGVTAIFNVDMLRTPYFFKDRDKTITVGGKAKKIFHIARAHERTTAGGAKSFVRSHFRGERKFTWNGYRVTISMPGLHHSMLQRFTVAAIDVFKARKPKEPVLDARELGEFMANHLDKAA